jgi:hypothetical protein
MPHTLPKPKKRQMFWVLADRGKPRQKGRRDIRIVWKGKEKPTDVGKDYFVESNKTYYLKTAYYLLRLRLTVK